MRVDRSADLLLRRENWTQRVGGFTKLPHLIRQLGADPVAVLQDASIKAEDLADAENRVPFIGASNLLGVAARAISCPHFGLLVGRLWDLADMGVLGEAVRHSPTLDAALNMLVVHQHLMSNGGLAFLIERSSVVDLGFAIYHSSTEDSEVFYDASLAAGVNYVRELVGRAWAPTEVFLPHVRPDEVAHYRAFFKVLPHFNAEFCAVRFPVEQMQLPVLGADPQRLQAAIDRLSTHDPASLLQQVYRAVRRLLLEERHSGDDVAQLLSMHRRTLNRRLQVLGTSFQEILDDVRFQVARELLASETPLDDIAATLGYAAVTPFMRTFRRWSGTTPGQWRAELRRHSRTPGMETTRRLGQ